MGRKPLLVLAGTILAAVILYLLPRTPEPEEKVEPARETEEGPSFPAELEDLIQQALKGSDQNLMVHAGETGIQYCVEKTTEADCTDLLNQCLELFDKAIESGNTSSDARAGSAYCTALTSPQPMPGILGLRELAKTDSLNWKIHYYLGLLSMKSNQSSKAVERFQKAVSLNIENFSLLLHLAEGFAANKEPEKALEKIEAFLNFAGPNHPLKERAENLKKTIFNKNI